MNIAISAPSSTFPKLVKLEQLFRKWELKPSTKHRYRIYCSKLREQDIRRLFDGLPVEIDNSLPGINRHSPMLDNEIFQHIAQKETEGPWFLLNHYSVPVSPDWADKLASEYLQSGKSYLGKAAYTPRHYRDHSGVNRVAEGDPYLLETAVYPPNMLKSLRTRLLNATTHHESLKARETFHMAHLSGLVASADWNPNFRLENVGSSVVVTRLVGDAVIDEMLGFAVPPPETRIVEVEAPAAPPPPEPLKEPTIKIRTRAEYEAEEAVKESLTVEEHSTIPVDEVTLPVRRKPGRPAALKK